MGLMVVRSPAKVCWHIKLGNMTIATANTREAANKVVNDLNRKYFNA